MISPGHHAGQVILAVVRTELVADRAEHSVGFLPASGGGIQITQGAVGFGNLWGALPEDGGELIDGGQQYGLSFHVTRGVEQ